MKIVRSKEVAEVGVSHNVEIRKKVLLEKGTIPVLPDNSKPHWELIEQYDIIDFNLGKHNQTFS